MSKCTVAAATTSKLNTTASMNWFLCDSGDKSPPVAATFAPLINGKEAFTTLHEKIEKAEHSIEIAIWGFQPSMHFKRDGKSKCIGDLLIEKANQGVQVRILVWSMPANMQTFQEANLGNAPGVFKGGVPGVTGAQKEYDRYHNTAITLLPTGVTGAQKEYDRYWYQAIDGRMHTKYELPANADNDTIKLNMQAKYNIQRK